MGYLCKYCGKEFETKQQLGGHSTYCEKNPKKQTNLEKLGVCRKNINYNNCNNILLAWRIFYLQIHNYK